MRNGKTLEQGVRGILGESFEQLIAFSMGGFLDGLLNGHAKSIFPPASRVAETKTAKIMTADKAKPRIGKHDAGQLDRWHRNAASQPEIRAAAKDQTRTIAREGNQNSLVHGIYADRFLAPDERPLFEAIIGQLYQDFVFNKSSDFMQVELVAVYFLKLGRAQEAGDWDAAERLDRMIRCHLKDLKATKIAREGEVPSGPGTTPAEWATALLEKVAESQKKPARKPRKRRKTRK